MEISILEVRLIYHIVLVSGVEQNDSVTYILIHILFHYGLL